MNHLLINGRRTNSRYEAGRFYLMGDQNPSETDCGTSTGILSEEERKNFGVCDGGR